MSETPLQIGPATLALRSHEVISLHDAMPDRPVWWRLYGVAIIPAPEFPGERAQPFTGKAALLVACIGKFSDGWGFIELDGGTKQAIGDMMAEHRKCEPGRWYWMELQRRIE